MVKYAYRPAGGSWSTQALATGPGDETSIAVDAQGGVHITYYDHLVMALGYAYKAAGRLWSVQIHDYYPPGVSLNGRYTSVVVDALGGVHVSNLGDGLLYSKLYCP